jgi:hypothetical protein
MVYPDNPPTGSTTEDSSFKFKIVRGCGWPTFIYEALFYSISLTFLGSVGPLPDPKVKVKVNPRVSNRSPKLSELV